jgi:hypothetical protein
MILFWLFHSYGVSRGTWWVSWTTVAKWVSNFVRGYLAWLGKQLVVAIFSSQEFLDLKSWSPWIPQVLSGYWVSPSALAIRRSMLNSRRGPKNETWIFGSVPTGQLSSTQVLGLRPLYFWGKTEAITQLLFFPMNTLLFVKQH